MNTVPTVYIPPNHLVIEKELAMFECRPHWGKLFAMSPAELKSRYERSPDFIQLSSKYDPRGKFHNAFLDRKIFRSYFSFSTENESREVSTTDEKISEHSQQG